MPNMRGTGSEGQGKDRGYSASEEVLNVTHGLIHVTCNDNVCWLIIT